MPRPLATAILATLAALALAAAPAAASDQASDGSRTFYPHCSVLDGLTPRLDCLCPWPLLPPGLCPF